MEQVKMEQDTGESDKSSDEDTESSGSEEDSSGKFTCFVVRCIKFKFFYLFNLLLKCEGGEKRFFLFKQFVHFKPFFLIIFLNL